MICNLKCYACFCFIEFPRFKKIHRLIARINFFLFLIYSPNNIYYSNRTILFLNVGSWKSKSNILAIKAGKQQQIIKESELNFFFGKIQERKMRKTLIIQNLALRVLCSLYNKIIKKCT